MIFSIGNRRFQRNRSTALSLLLSCSLSLCVAAAAIDPAERDTIYAELQEPIIIHLKNTRSIPGHSIEVSENQLHVATSEGAGEIIYTFSINEIQSFSIPGESYKTLAVEWIKSGNSENALELLELLFQQRSKLIPFLPPSESHFFIYYVELILDSPNPARAIAITERLKPQISNPAALHALDDAVLESYNTLHLYDQVRPLAEAWVASRDPYDGSALGYYALGAAHLRAEEFDTALELALKPIVFSSPTPKDKLAHCYAVAICAALELRDKTYALTLYREMQERALTWPDDDPTFDIYRSKITKAEANSLNTHSTP
jgi:tetratricopeptide (TPR) repeat protein